MIPVSDSQVTHPSDLKRLSAQSQAIVERLMWGPMNTVQLAEIAKQYSARIADARKVGWNIEQYNYDAETGIAWYRLIGDEPVLRHFTIPVVVRVHGQAPMRFDYPVLAASEKQARQAARFNAATVTVESDDDEDR